MKRKKISILVGVICLALIIAVMPFVAACAKEAPAPAPTPTPAGEQEPIVIKYACMIGPTIAQSQGDKEWAKAVTERTKGRVTFEWYWSGALGIASEYPRMLKEGIIQMSNSPPSSFHPALTPLSTIYEIPSVTDSDDAMIRALMDVVKEVPEVEQEWNETNAMILYPACETAGYLITSKPVRTLEDMKGLRIRTWGRLAALIDGLGGTSMAIPRADVPMAVEKGTVDGVCLALDAMVKAGYYNKLRYVVVSPTLIYGAQMVVLSLDTWNKFTPETQRIVREECENQYKRGLAINLKETEEAIKVCEKEGVEFITLSDAVKAEWMEKAKLVWEDWLKDKEEKGIGEPARRTLDTFLSSIEKYEKETR